MYIFQRLMTTTLMMVLLGFNFCTFAQSTPYQLTKTTSGYKISGLPAKLLADLSELPEREKVFMSLVDPNYGESKITGYIRAVDKSSLSLTTKESFVFHPDLNRTYLIFELSDKSSEGGGCSGCSLTNRNLKANSPQICWCFSRLMAEDGDSNCGIVVERLRFPTPAESVIKLKDQISEPWATEMIYHECYPSSGSGGEDCSIFNTICQAAGGGTSKLPGGGYGCSVN